MVAGLNQHSTVTTLGSSGLTGGSAYYHTDGGHDHHGPAKYHENGMIFVLKYKTYLLVHVTKSL